MRKYIYYFRISDENKNVDMQKFPIVYESNLEVVFVINKGITKTLSKNSHDFNANINNEDIIDLFKSNKKYLYCIDYNDNFNPKEMYYAINDSKILMTLDKYRSDIIEKYKDLCKDINEYNTFLNDANKYCYVKGAKYGNIKLVEEKRE